MHRIDIFTSYGLQHPKNIKDIHPYYRFSFASFIDNISESKIEFAIFAQGKCNWDKDNKCKQYVSESWISQINLSQFNDPKKWKVWKDKEERRGAAAGDVMYLKPI